MRSRRLACFLLGIWFGGEVLMAWIAADPYRSVDRLSAEPNPAAMIHIRDAGSPGIRLMRYEAAEQVRGFLSGWGLAEIGLVGFAFLFLLFGTQEGKITLAMALAMESLVMGQRLFLAPEMAALGRMLDFAALQALPAERVRLSVLENAYWGLELLKWGLGALLLVRLTLHRRARSGDSRKQFDLVDKPNYGHIDR